MDTAGPLSKTVADAALVYSALTGEALPAWNEAKLEHAVLGLVSYAYNDPKELARLRGNCIEEVKRINGTISLDDAVNWQLGEDEVDGQNGA